MGQFDSRMDAAETQLEAENRASSLVGIPSGFLDLAAFITDLIADKEIALPLKAVVGCLKYLASKRAEDNVKYLLESVSEDLKDTISQVQQQKEQIEEIEKALKSERFAELLTEGALQATRTSSHKRIERLAQIVVSGSIMFQDKPLDAVVDFERYCVELTDADILLLNFLARQQPNFRGLAENEWAQQIRMNWLNMPQTSEYAGVPAVDARSSFARLQSRGLISQLSWGNVTAGRGSDPYAVLEEGRIFLRFLRNSLQEVPPHA